MCSCKGPISAIPLDTYQAARQIYNPTHIYLRIGDQLDNILTRIDLPALDLMMPVDRELLSRLALITAFQYAEYLPDIVASDATRKRIDWKYALHLPVHHHGVPAQALSEFRQRVFSSQQALNDYALFLDTLNETGLYLSKGQSDLISNTVLQSVCQITRLHQLYAGMKAALSLLVSTAPDWLRSTALSYWYERYKTGQLVQPTSRSSEEIEEEAIRMGTDMQHLLTALRKQSPAGVIDQAEIRNLIQLLEDQFILTGDGIHWQLIGCAHCTKKT